MQWHYIAIVKVIASRVPDKNSRIGQMRQGRGRVEVGEHACHVAALRLVECCSAGQIEVVVAYGQGYRAEAGNKTTTQDFSCS